MCRSSSPLKKCSNPVYFQWPTKKKQTQTKYKNTQKMGSQKLKHKIQRLANDWEFPLMREQNISYLLYYRQMVRVTLGYEKRRFANAKTHFHFHVPAMNEWMIYRSKKSATANGVVVISMVLSSSLDVDGLIEKLRSYNIDCSICSSLEWNGSEKKMCVMCDRVQIICALFELMA